MSFDLALWKWHEPKPRKVNIDDVYSELAEDQEHPAVSAFDRAEAEAALAKEFGVASLDELFEISALYRCLVIHIPWSKVDEATPRIRKVAAAHGLHCHNPQNSKGLPWLEPTKKELSSEFERTKAKAESGDVDAQARLGFYLEFGEGVRKDLKGAVAWYTKAADQGNREALFNLAGCYRNGTGLKKQPPKAVEIYSKLIALGDEDAMQALAEMYEQGDGVPKDLEKALKYYREASDKGLVDAKKAVLRLSRGG